MERVFWLVPLSRKEKQIRAEETGSLDKTLPLTNLDSLSSLAKLQSLLCADFLNMYSCEKLRWRIKIDLKMQGTYKAVVFNQVGVRIKSIYSRSVSLNRVPRFFLQEPPTPWH